MHKLYTQFYAQRLFTLTEANKIVKDYQVCKNALQRLLKKNQIKRITSGLYYIIPIDNKDFYPDPIHIASKLRENAIISCNSALYTYKIYTKENTIYSIATHASKIRLKDITYRFLTKKPEIGINELEYTAPYAKVEIRITDFERTIIDCLWNKSIHIDQLINAIKYAKSINIPLTIPKIVTYLEKLKKPILYHKIGFVLEAVKEHYTISESDLEPIKKKLSKKIFYFRERGLRLTRPRYVFNNTWRVMIHEKNYVMIYPKKE